MANDTTDAAPAPRRVGWGRFPESPSLGPLHSVEIREQHVRGAGLRLVAAAACSRVRMSVVQPLTPTPPTRAMGVCPDCIATIATRARRAAS